MVSIELKGWIEREGRRLSDREVEEILWATPDQILSFGGEFFLRWNDCLARDHFGVMRGGSPPGVVICGGKEARRIKPVYPPMELGLAIEKAVQLRSDEGVVALSGGVDSALVAFLAGRECVAVGLEGSHDLKRARQVAEELDLSLELVVITVEDIEDALREVLAVIPKANPVDASIATTLYFVAGWAGEHGHRRILAGQGADELFGGYARYLQTPTLGEDLERDFLGLQDQAARDQAVASLHGAYFSLPYLDVRVVLAARIIPPEEKVKEGVRKRPLREVAARYLPHSIAYYEKKAMQYGSGVMREMKRMAKREGYKGVGDFLKDISKEE